MTVCSVLGRGIPNVSMWTGGHAKASCPHAASIAIVASETRCVPLAGKGEGHRR
jgi:hypothetical protein